MTRNYQIRPFTVADRDPLRILLDRCSAHTRYARFLTCTVSAPHAYAASLHTDPDCYSAVVAYGAGLVAEGSLFFEGSGPAEIALLVRDDHQGRGVGALLAGHLCAYAAGRGVRSLQMSVLATNTRIIRLFRRAVTAADFGPPDAGVVTATLQLPAPAAAPLAA